MEKLPNLSLVGRRRLQMLPKLPFWTPKPHFCLLCRQKQVWKSDGNVPPDCTRHCGGTSLCGNLMESPSHSGCRHGGGYAAALDRRQPPLWIPLHHMGVCMGMTVWVRVFGTPVQFLRTCRQCPFAYGFPMGLNSQPSNYHSALYLQSSEAMADAEFSVQRSTTASQSRPRS